MASRPRSIDAAPIAAPSCVARWRREVRAGRDALREAFLAKPDTPRLLREHARLVDRVLRGLWAESAMPRGAALVAVGGYGRGQLFPHSDVDVLLVIPDDALPAELAAIEGLVGMLWDLGLQIGHSVRTAAQCREEAARDVTVLTSMIESRRVAGPALLFDQFASELGYRQCSHCPLEPEEHPHCPMALQLHDIVERLHDTRSIDEVELEVRAQDRRFLQTTALQHVLSSMLGLITPICRCPKAAYMRPLARFHPPLANEEETVFRVAGMYLLAQYFLIQNGKGGKFDFDGVVRIYEDLHEVNKAGASRLQLATASDTVKNAITLIDMYCTLVPMLLEDHMVEIRSFFGRGEGRVSRCTRLFC